MSSASSREIFEAIVSQLDDPEAARVRRLVIVLASMLFVMTMSVTVLAGLGWYSFLAFSSTFLPGVLLVRRLASRRFARPTRLPRWRRGSG